MLTHALGVTAQHKEWDVALASNGIQAAWRLSEWDEVDIFLQTYNLHSHDPKIEQLVDFNFQLSKILSSFYRSQDADLERYVNDSRLSIAESLAASSSETYKRSYDLMLQLHVLDEILAFSNLLKQNTNHDELDVDRQYSLWQERLKITFPSIQIREPILSVRRVLTETFG
jgi:serine/threonine-protein kinase ATR